MADKTASEFLDRLAARDFERLAATLAPDAQARFLLPKGAEGQSGRDAIVKRFQDWFSAASEFELVSSNQEPIGGRHRVSWRCRVLRSGRGRELVEQVAFVDTSADGISRMDMVCSGFQPEQAGEVYVFDAGTMGCADGLAQEFRRQLTCVPVGDSLSVVVSDPAAREDLPALARMLGHAVTSIEAREDGRLSITVEVCK